MVYSENVHECMELNLSEKIGMAIEWKYFLKRCVDASPTVIAYQNGATVVSVGSHSGDLVQLDFNSGLLKSSCHLPDRIESSLTVSHCGKYGYIGCYDGYLRCIDLETGQPVLSFASSGMVKSTPILDEKGSIIFGSYDQHLYCISDELQVIWKWKGGGSFYATPCIDKDSNLVFAGLLDGTCVCLEIDKEP
ncbi:beta-alanine-activating enzyme-like [Nilaparvata lugens]|uniref:beta-alanine-activating enzyme n=1 Tax=Nilaparvata lugens TaxID=108931 RepID=UPI00193CA5B5|nr:beta-alanine-activating enzyme [Nilaparvata lugens]XP_039278147.1 beta-alanine-activating enzyme-like [Nilaparvata lugens]